MESTSLSSLSMPHPPRSDIWRCWFPASVRINIGLSRFPHASGSNVSIARRCGLRALFYRTHKTISTTRSGVVVSNVESIACVWLKPRDDITGRCALNPSARFRCRFARFSPVDLIVGIAGKRCNMNNRAVIASRYRVAHLKSPQRKFALLTQRTEEMNHSNR